MHRFPMEKTDGVLSNTCASDLMGSSSTLMSTISDVLVTPFAVMKLTDLGPSLVVRPMALTFSLEIKSCPHPVSMMKRIGGPSYLSTAMNIVSPGIV